MVQVTLPEEPPRRGMPGFPLVALGAAGFVLAFAAVVLLHPGTAWQRLVFVDVVTFVVPLAAAAACAWRATAESRPLRVAWVLLAAGCASWAIGQAAWAAYVLILGLDGAPSPGIADAGYLAMVPLAGAGLLAFLRGPGERANRLRFLLDAAIIAGSLLFISWAAAIRDVVGATAAEGVSVAEMVYLAYPTGDVLLASLAFVLLGQARSGERRTLAFLGTGALALAVADTAYVVQGLRGIFEDASVVHTGWIAGFLLIGLAALRPQRMAAVPTRRPTLAGATLPLWPLLLAIGTSLQSRSEHGLLSGFQYGLLLVLLLLVIARQLAVLLENLRLTRQAEATLADLRASEQARLSLIHTVTHDLQNPLTPIRLQLAILEDSPEAPAGIHRSLAIIGRNVAQVERLVADLGDVAKLADGRLALQPSAIDAADTLRDVHASFAPAAHERGITLTLDAPGALATMADPVRLRQVVVNLVSNALKFTPRGGSARLAGSLVDGHVRIEVSDSGRGLDEGEAARLFQPFSQVHAPGEAAERGTGLGLFISKGIVEAHGGTVGVRSTGRGHGSTFWLALPAAPAAPTATPVASPSPDTSGAHVNA